MAPPITKWSDLAHVSEESNPETGEFQYTMFAVVDLDDVIYYCELPTRKAEISFRQVSAALKPIPSSEIYLEWPSAQPLTQAPLLPPAADIYIKRPNLRQYDVFSRHKQQHLLAQSLLEEAYVMEFLSKHPHPHIVRYHGCRSQRGYLTGILLDRHQCTLKSYLKKGTGTIDKEAFMAALQSAIHHLHSLGWAHNDLNPTNVMVNEAMPVLIDFGSAREVGKLLGTSRGTRGWYEGRIEDYTTSEKEHDIFALAKIRTWLDSPIFSDDGEEDDDDENDEGGLDNSC